MNSLQTHSNLRQITVNRARTADFDKADDVRDLPSSERSTIRLYLQEIGKTALLKPAEEIELAALIQQGDPHAREKMIKANLRLVVKIAHDYSGFGLPLVDLISEGNIGLVKAVERFDPRKGGKLSTYAAWWIKQSIKRALANQSKTIRLPVHLVDKIARMRRVTYELEEALGRIPNNDEIAHAMGISVNKVAHLHSVSVRPASLDAPVGEDGDGSFGELIGDESAVNPLDSLHDRSVRRTLLRLIDSLDPREAEIIRLRFGLNGDKPLTLEEVGERFGITRERVRQLQNLTLHHMRRELLEQERQRSGDEIEVERREIGRMEVLQEFFASTGSVRARSDN
jgi:RNA polymerase primary sigma factor